MHGARVVGEVTWYTVVGFGPIPGKGGAYRDRGDAAARVRRAQFRDAAEALGGITGDLRVHGYRSRACARDGDVSHQVGEAGRVC